MLFQSTLRIIEMKREKLVSYIDYAYFCNVFFKILSKMKKIVLLLLAGLLLVPTGMFADKYKSKVVTPIGSPARMPAIYFVSLYLDENTGDLAISPNYDITDLQITIVSNGVTYLNTTVSLNAGQAYTDCLDYLGEGTYILTMSTSAGVIDQYEITVEED